jgi:hypothetical protein
VTSRGLAPGLYLVYWKGTGPTSVAAIGVCEDGRNWLAPTNWVRPATDHLVWRQVERVKRISTDDFKES